MLGQQNVTPAGVKTLLEAAAVSLKAISALQACLTASSKEEGPKILTCVLMSGLRDSKNFENFIFSVNVQISGFLLLPLLKYLLAAFEISSARSFTD
ncbi:hypothetical protein AVEN_90381-1 [Araneus ventricosus]|uniref:Uncharacterized protein n=1 Tax=Araneus ventricosus TaxID=182803 RepID=A0A4Y2C8S8_ARAVE|nr:hypothetical protein AVEN_67624-1 [Araneus ventricosus]GBM00841.1 hypothetical protein AVEN_90381-1 [Araneus ventricosus]